MERRRFMDRWPQIRIDESDDENSRISGDVVGKRGGIQSSDSLLSRCFMCGS